MWCLLTARLRTRYLIADTGWSTSERMLAVSVESRPVVYGSHLWLLKASLVMTSIPTMQRC